MTSIVQHNGKKSEQLTDDEVAEYSQYRTTNPLSPKLVDKQAIEDELNIDGGKHVLACF